jgi:hypothetical protein
MTRWGILVLLVLTLSATFDTALAGDLVDDPAVLDMFADVLNHVRFGMDTENAAFIVREKDGTHQCVFWPNTAEYRQSHYQGPPPAGVVAIVHTHPYSLPVVSSGDRATAMRLGIPVYAITARSIYEADALGRVVKVTDDEWTAARKRPGACEAK